jgi:hypothetical protein
VRPFGEAKAFEFANYIVHRDEKVIAPAIMAFIDWLLGEAPPLEY